MKNKIGLLILLISLVGGVYWFGFRVEPMVGENIATEVVGEEEVYLTIDFGDETTSYSGALFEEDTVLTILKRFSEKKHELLIKDYDFGSLVMSIDGKENNSDKSWIYFVNGNSGEVGADQKIVEKGDLVEWRYIKPIY